jgi:hypothetical protein
MIRIAERLDDCRDQIRPKPVPHAVPQDEAEKVRQVHQGQVELAEG